VVPPESPPKDSMPGQAGLGRKCGSPPVCGSRCGIGTTVQVTFETSLRSHQFVHSATSLDVKMEKKGFSGRNVHIHHSLCHRSVKKRQHEALICIVSLPLSCHRYWILRGTKLMVDTERSIRGVQSFNTARTGCLLRKFLEQTRALKSILVGMARHMLRGDEVGLVFCEDLGE
jgi:hypothetical protein